MTQRKASTKVTAKPPQSTAYYSASNSPTEIAKELADNVDGWDAMSDAVKSEIVALNMAANLMPSPPKMAIVDGVVQPNAVNPQLHTMRLVQAFGSSSGAFLTYTIDRLATTLKASGGLTEASLNGALAFVNSLNPKNEAEAMLAVQMFLTNDAAMRAMRTLNGAEYADTAQQFGNLSVKLMRTFTMQVEALAKLQRGGVQTVKHIHIDNRGGQAVVTDQVHSGGQNAKIEYQSDALGSALPRKDTEGDALPVALCEGPEALSDARRH